MRSASFVSRLAAALSVLFCAMPGCRALAAGFYLEDQSVKGAGRAYSGEAADMGAESLWWNPASIAGIERSETYGGATGIIVSSKVTDNSSRIDYFGQTGPMTGDRRVENPISSGLVPSSAVAARLNAQWALGLALTSPFSVVSKYPADSWTRYDALTSRMTTIAIQPSVAWRPTHWLGIGIGPNIEYLVTALSGALPNLVPGQPDGQQSLHASGWNVGFNAGLQLHLSDRLTFGAAYRSAIEHRLSGKLTISGLTGPLDAEDLQADAGMHFTTPAAATFGFRWQATDRLALNVQAVRQMWSDFNVITVTSPILSQTQENYRDTLNGAFGADFRVIPGWILRSGLQYDPTPTPGSTRDARTPDANRWLFSAGTSVQATRRVCVDAAVSYIDFQHAGIVRDASAYVGTPVQIPMSLDGTAEASGVLIALGIRTWF